MAQPPKIRLSCDECGPLGEFRSEANLRNVRLVHNDETGHAQYHRVNIDEDGNEVRPGGGGQRKVFVNGQPVDGG